MSKATAESTTRETLRVTRTVRNEGKGEKARSIKIEVAPYTRVVNGKTITVAGYSYSRRK